MFIHKKPKLNSNRIKAIFKIVFDAVHTAIADSLRGDFDIPEGDNKNNSEDETEKNTIRKENL